MMATYFHGGSEIQAAAAAAAAGDHNLQTLYLMNPNFITTTPFSEAQTSPSMLFLNPPNALSQGNLPHAPPHQHQQFIGIPLGAGGPHPSQDHGRTSPSSSGSQQQHHQNHQIPPALHGLSVSRVHPNLWTPAGSNPQGPIPSTAVSGPDMADQMGFRRPMVAHHHQGLSLSLSPGQQQQQQQNQNQVTIAGGGSSSSASNGVVIGSKYLKPTQELLEEVVNVGSNNTSTNFNDKANTSSGGCTTTNNNGDNRTGDSSGAHKEKAKAAARVHSSVGEGISRGGSGGSGGGESSSGGSKKAAEISTAQRQELQMKKAKLLNMLDEVEQRYRQYNSQIQVVVSSFEQAAGIGSAKLYTSLALKTISKQFRCLKDAIMSQIKATSKTLGEDESSSNGIGVKLEGGAGSRLRFVDHQLRQQRALQQLGMMQPNAWRPQRGLPERAVSVLRAWLFEHFLHPYPKDSDKHMLAKQTGLTRSQVSNWFINARVRLWKPMVEDMYLEEVKTQEQNSGNSEDNTTTANKNGKSSKNEDHSTSKETRDMGQQQQHEQQDHGRAVMQQQAHQQQPDHTTNDMISNLSAMSATSSQGFTLIGSSSDMESLMARSPKKQRSNSDMQNINSPSSILSMDMEMKPVDHHHQRHSFMMTNHGDAPTGFNPYLVNDMTGQMTTHPYHGNAVSLTLGLPHCENLSLGNHQQNFLPNNQGIQLGRRLDIGPGEAADFCGISMAQPSHHPNSNGYETIDIQNRKRFAAQLLHDFVA